MLFPFITNRNFGNFGQDKKSDINHLKQLRVSNQYYFSLNGQKGLFLFAAVEIKSVFERFSTDDDVHLLEYVLC